MVRRHSTDPPHSRATRPHPRWLASPEPLAQQRDAEGALRPRAADHHPADGHPAIGDRLRVHGAALERRHATPVGRRGAGYRGADRRLSRYAAGQGSDAHSHHRAAAARPGGRFPPRRRNAATRSEAVFLAARSNLVGRAAQADPAAVLDRHRRQVGAGRDPHPARQ